MGKTTHFIIQNGVKDIHIELILAAVALVACIAQFTMGHWLGRRYGDEPAGGQALGQKNTVLAIWLAQSFLNPLSSVAPTAYIVWQNIVNSYQIYKHR
jgi:BASS family bile acid:Na+ symporter